MENISSNTQLAEAIQLLEAEQAIKLKLIKEDFYQIYEGLKPANLIESTLKDIAASPYLLDNLLSTAVGLAAGYVSKVAIADRSDSKFKKFLGAFLQFSITNIIAQNPKAIKSFVQYISHRIFHKEK